MQFKTMISFEIMYLSHQNLCTASINWCKLGIIVVQGIFTGNSIAGAPVHNDGTSQMKGRKYIFLKAHISTKSSKHGPVAFSEMEI